ncbi:MAG: SusD/RagB family nutrient-binding outer membrane lipoprotein [Bacteroidota bacterium]
MKSNNFYKTIVILFTILISASCGDFLDVNDNPNAPVGSNLTLNAQLPAALAGTVNQETDQLNLLGSLWGGYWGTTAEGINLFFNQKAYSGQGLRDVRDGYPVWETSYLLLLQYQLIRDQAEKEGELFFLGITKIMQGWHFLRLVDTYNHIPYEEALQGTKKATPAYEPGEQVYKKSIDLITSGMNDITSAGSSMSPGNSDILFKGNRTLWLRFANTIKLRALIRQSEVATPAYIQQEIGKIMAEGSGFLSAGQNALVQPGYLQTAGKMNPFYERYYRNVQNVVTANYQDIRPTEYLLESYLASNDPRLDRLYTKVNGSYKGVRFGDPVVDRTRYGRDVTSAFRGPAENGGQPAGLFKSPVQASVLMTSAESIFLQCEAAWRGWITAPAESLYRDAIGESFNYLGVPSGHITEFLTRPGVAYEGTLEQIIRQKWLALNSLSGIEAWNDFRRLGLPAFPNSLMVNNPELRPQRLMYPETERMTNLTEVLKQGNDHLLESKVWWAKQNN